MEQLPTFPMARRCPYGPPPEYEKLRADAAVVKVAFHGDRPVWVVTRHAEAQQVLTHPAISTDPKRPGHPLATAAGSPQGHQPGDFIDMDDPEHARYRRILIPEFGTRRIRAMREGIQATVDALIDGLLTGQQADLVQDFGLPIATQVICQLLGVPYEDHTYFHARTRKMVVGLGTPEEAKAAMRDVMAYVNSLVARAEKAPGDDLIGRLVTDRWATGDLSHEEIVGMVFLLFVAGHQTTANIIPLSVLTLLDHPAQLLELQADPTLWPAAVEELLRLHSVVDWVAFDRVAVDDVKIGDHVIKAGEGMFVLGASANHDDRVFATPGSFDIHRKQGHHLAFGYGAHQCLGQNLARTEIEIALRSLFDRVPTLQLAVPVDELSIKATAGTFGLHHLRVTW